MESTIVPSQSTRYASNEPAGNFSFIPFRVSAPHSKRVVKAALIERLPAVRRADKLRPSMAPSPPSDSNSQVQIQPRSLGGFWALIAVQFQGAFSDNALKWLVSFLVLDAAISKERRDLWFVLVVPLLFAVPFLLFSIPGGYLADRYSKRSVTLW